MTDECPGEGKCHGSLDWCELCEEVRWVCDDPFCHAHNDRLLNAPRDEQRIGQKKLPGHAVCRGWRRVR